MVELAAERNERNFLVREHRSGSFSRSLRLPYAVDADAAQASYEQGVLRLSLPKAGAGRSGVAASTRVRGSGGAKPPGNK